MQVYKAEEARTKLEAERCIAGAQAAMEQKTTVLTLRKVNGYSFLLPSHRDDRGPAPVNRLCMYAFQEIIRY